MKTTMIYSTSRAAHSLRAPFLNDLTLDYWRVIKSTLRAIQQDSSMKTTCRSAAQLLPPTGNPAHDLMARFL